MPHRKRLRALLIRARRRQRLHALLVRRHAMLLAAPRRQVRVRRQPVRRQLPARLLRLRWRLRPPCRRLPRSPSPPADGRNHEAARQPTYHHDLRGLVRATLLLRLLRLLRPGIVGWYRCDVQSFVRKAHRAVDLRSSAGLRREETRSQGGEAEHDERNAHSPPNRRLARSWRWGENLTICTRSKKRCLAWHEMELDNSSLFLLGWGRRRLRRGQSQVEQVVVEHAVLAERALVVERVAEAARGE